MDQENGIIYSAKNIILARDDVLVDVMTAIPLSKKLDAPIPMSPSGSLDSSVLAEMQSLKATSVYIIGGTGAISSGMEDTLRGMGLNVNRLGGADQRRDFGCFGSPGWGTGC